MIKSSKRSDVKKNSAKARQPDAPKASDDLWADTKEKKKEEAPKEEVVDEEVFDLNKQIAALQNELGGALGQTDEQVAKKTAEAEEEKEYGGKEEGDEMRAVLTPAERSTKFYERAKAFYTNCSGSSLELEIVTRDVVAASAYADDLKLYYFLAKVFKQNLDYSSAIYALRNALRVDSTYKPARKMIAEVLVLRGREIMGEATISNEKLQKAKKINRAVEARRVEQEEAKKVEKAKQARLKASQKIADVLNNKQEDKAEVRGEKEPNSPVPHKEPERINFQVPRKFEQYVNSQYKTARVHFDESLEYDRDNYSALTFKGVCLVQANELTEAMDTLVRAAHLVSVQLKNLYPVRKLRFNSQSAIESSKMVLTVLSSQGDRVAGDDGEASAAASAAVGGPKSTEGAEHVATQAVDKDGTMYIYNESIEYESEEAAEESKVLTRKLAEISILRAKIYWGQGLNESGNEEMRKASSIVPSHPEIKKFGIRSYVRAEKVYNMCQKKFREGELEEAKNLITNAIALSSQDVKLYVMQAKIYRNLDDTEAAFASIQRATNLYQQASEGQYEMKVPEEIIKETNLVFNDKALVCAAAGEYDRSVGLLNRAILAEISLHRSNKLGDTIGMLHTTHGGPEGGMVTDGGPASTSESIGGRGGDFPLECVDFRFLLNRGDCLRAQRKFGLALIDYDAAMANLKLKRLGASSGVEGARRQWNVTTRLSLTHYLVACDYFNENAFEDAERQLTLAVEYNPKVSEYYQSRGRARYYTGRHQDAYDDFKACYALDPGNNDVLLRLKQFEANHPGVVVDTSVAAAGAPTGGVKKRPKEEGISLKEAKNDNRSIPAIPTTDGDRLASLLYAAQARSLPEVAAQLKAQREIKAAIPVRLLEGESGDPNERYYGNDALPHLNPNLTTAAVVAVDRDRKHTRVQSIMHSEVDSTKGTLWTAFTNAQKSAKLVSKPAPNAEHTGAALADDDDDLESVESAGGTRRKKTKSYTVSGLKRFSQKRTAKALRNGGLIKGVITHQDDPFVKAYNAEQEARGVGPDGAPSKGKLAITISVTSRPRPNKWRSGAGTGTDGGGVESYSSVDQQADLLNETKSGGWRLKLREEQERKERELNAQRMAANARFYSTKGMTVEEEREHNRRIAQMESTGELTKSAEEKQRLADEEKERRRRRRQKRKHRQDVNAPKEGPLDGEGVMDDDDIDESEDEEAARVRANLTAGRNDSGIAALLAQAGVENWGNIWNEGNEEGGIVIDEENESSLIAMTEEEELQLAYEQRIKAEHEEQRQKRAARREEIMKKNSLAFLES
jgi:tetratricopeptide (TPR) repeat protein